MEKLCTKCGVSKLADTKHFYKNKQTKDGLHGHCKQCKSKTHREYMSDPEIHKRVVAKIMLWQRTSPKAKLIRKRSDTSEKRVAWRRKRQ